MDPKAIDQLVELMEAKTSLWPPSPPLQSREEINNPNCVKVLPIKTVWRFISPAALFRIPAKDFRPFRDFPHLLHLGIYAYRKDFLLKLTTLPPAPLEQIEILEQLRVLWNGYNIKVGMTPCRTSGIDTPEQYKEFVEEYRKRSAKC